VEDLQDIFLFCYLQFFNTGMTFFVVEFLRIFVGVDFLFLSDLTMKE